MVSKLIEIRLPKPAKRFSLIQRDSVGFRTVQIVVPKEGKTRDNVAPKDYEITTVGLGKPTQAQEIQDFDDSCNVLKVRLAKEREKRMKVEEENQQWKRYVQQWMKPLDQEEVPVTLPIPLPQESLKDYEDMKATFKEVKEWTVDASERADILIENLIAEHESTSSLLSRIRDIAETWEDMEAIQKRIIPYLKVIRGLSRQDLVN